MARRGRGGQAAEEGEQPGGCRWLRDGATAAAQPAGGARTAALPAEPAEGGGWSGHPRLYRSYATGVCGLWAPPRSFLGVGGGGGAVTHTSFPYPAQARSPPRTAPRRGSPAPPPLPSQRLIQSARLFSPPQHPSWFSPGQALGISPVPFEEPRCGLAFFPPTAAAHYLVPTGPSRPSAGSSTSSCCPCPARAHEAGSAVGGARRRERRRQQQQQPPHPGPPPRPGPSPAGEGREGERGEGEPEPKPFLPVVWRSRGRRRGRGGGDPPHLRRAHPAPARPGRQGAGCRSGDAGGFACG